jgi:Sulfatase-modifying factor enzyme 1
VTVDQHSATGAFGVSAGRPVTNRVHSIIIEGFSFTCDEGIRSPHLRAAGSSVRPRDVNLRTGLGILTLVFSAGCGVAIEEPGDLADAAADAALDDRFPADDRPSSDADAGQDVPLDRASLADGGCSAEMALVQGRVCVDRWEEHLEARDIDGGIAAWSPYVNPGTRWVRAVSTEGEVPQGYITGAESRDACRNAGKRLCALADWLAACRGPARQIYPYGNTYVHRRCNEGRTPHPVVQFYGTAVGVFTFARMNDPGINQQSDSLARAGAFTGCVSPDGLADMVGNLHEWIDDPAGTFKGGFYADAENNGRGCLYTTTAHNLDYRDYSTGFRCCANPR